MLDDATTQPFERFERYLRAWEQLADRDAATDRAERNHRDRRVRIRQRPDGSWQLSGSFGALQGSEINDILASFNDAEWRADWAEAQHARGDEVTPHDLRRTEEQRRADAFHVALLAAAAAPPAGNRPLPLLNIVVDAATAEAWATSERIDPSRYRDVVCRTRRGDPLPIDEACGAALWAHIRRVVTDSAGRVIDLGHRSRLFRGGAREAVMLLEEHCVWPGCDRPVSWCEADHSLAWRQHGATVPRNGGPMCRRHNLHKERGSFRVWRDDEGTWHVVDPDGNEID